MAVSVRKENRWRRAVYSANDEISRRQREAEAACLTRAPRPALQSPPPNATRRQVRSWMRGNAEGFASATALAEAANAALALPVGAMDDEGHWVWEEAVYALEQADT